MFILNSYHIQPHYPFHYIEVLAVPSFGFSGRSVLDRPQTVYIISISNTTDCWTAAGGSKQSDGVTYVVDTYRL